MTTHGVKTFLRLAILAMLAFGLLPDHGGVLAAPKEKAARPSVYIVSFGMFGPQSVFDSEARKGAGILAEYFRSPHPPFIRTNTKTASRVNSSTLAAAMRSAKRKLAPGKDILVLFLTSHGTEEGIAVIGRRRSGLLSPQAVGRMLEMSGARYRIVIVSACFSGIFADALADGNTLVITAAAADRASFGCEDRVNWTYFGDAFLNQSLKSGRTLQAAFQQAQEIVHEREKREGLEPPSNPQMRGGEAVMKLLGQ